MNYLNHDNCSIIGRDIECLCFGSEPAPTQPFGILGLEFAKDLVLLESGGHWVKIRGGWIHRSRRPDVALGNNPA